MGKYGTHEKVRRYVAKRRQARPGVTSRTFGVVHPW
jgi:hypothetical protein